MYCPSCGAQNIDDPKFCRACGTNLSLVSKALTGALEPTAPAGAEEGPRGLSDRHRGHERHEPGPEKAITNLCLGLGFLLVAISVFFFAPAGRIWWFWMLIPAFGLLGSGVAEMVRLRHGRGPAPPAASPREIPAPPQRSGLEPPSTSQVVPPPSVTEGTTRHLGELPDQREGAKGTE